MPTRKPIIQAVVSETVFKKFQAIAEKEKRTVSNLGQIAIINYVENYEAEHGAVEASQCSSDT